MRLEWLMKEEGDNEPLPGQTRHDGQVDEGSLLALAPDLRSDGKVQLKNGSVWKSEKMMDRPIDLIEEVGWASQCGKLREAWNGL